MQSISPRPWPVACALVAAAVFGTLLVLVAAGWEPLHRADARVAADLHTWVLDHPGWRSVLRFLTDWVWDPWDFRILAAAAALLVWWRGDLRTAAWIAAVMVLGGLGGTLVKVAVARERPTFTDPVATAPGWSFPSGHALNAVLGCAVLLAVLLPLAPRALRPVLWAAAAVSVLGTGFTRVALGVHYLSDVVAGWALGVVAAVALWGLFAVLWDPAADPVGTRFARGGDAASDTQRPPRRPAE